MREHLIAFVAAATKLATDAGVELRLGDEDSGLLRCGAGYWEPGKVLWMDGGDSEGKEVDVAAAVDKFLRMHKRDK